MLMKLFMQIGNDPFFLCYVDSPPINIREDDVVTFRVVSGEEDAFPDIYLGDYRIEVFEKKTENGSAVYETVCSTYFKECFGAVSLNIFKDNDLFVFNFNSFVKKENEKNVKDMVSYLLSQEVYELHSLFSRSSDEIKSKGQGKYNTESIISHAEKIVSFLQEKGRNGLTSLKSKLKPGPIYLYDSNFGLPEFYPYDVFNNMDCLIVEMPGQGNVIIRGRSFNFNCPQTTGLVTSYDIDENSIILGGVYSIKRKISSILKVLESIETSNVSIYGYESFDRIMLRLTSGGMIKRCENIIFRCDFFIKIMEKKYGISYLGEISPKITSFIRGVKYYRLAYELLSHWYNLGSIDIDGVNCLAKLRSISKLYEIFSFVKIVEYFYKNGWSVAGIKPHEELEYVAKKIEFERGSETVSFCYEPHISLFKENETKNNYIVDTGHSSRSKRPYRKPDFLIKYKKYGNVKYLVLDAKYSSENTIKKYSLESLYKKYYSGLSIYDENKKFLENKGIIGVVAIYAISYKYPKYVNYWPSNSLLSAIPKIPVVGGAYLSPSDDEIFTYVIDELLNIVRRV